MDDVSGTTTDPGAIKEALEAARAAVEIQSERAVADAVMTMVPESHLDAHAARGATSAATTAAFVLACALEFTSFDNPWPTTKALNAYWRALGIEP